MSKQKLISIGVFLVAISISLLTVWAYFGSTSPQKTTGQSSGTTTSLTDATSQQNSNNFPKVPAGIYNEAVIAARVIYDYDGIITEIVETPEGTQLTTNIVGNSIPKFLVTKDTKVVKQVGDKYEDISVKDLKKSQKVILTAEYRLKARLWRLTRVAIPDPKTSSTTPTPRP